MRIKTCLKRVDTRIDLCPELLDGSYDILHAGDSREVGTASTRGADN